MKIAILHSSDLDKISPGGVTQYVKQLINFVITVRLQFLGKVTIMLLKRERSRKESMQVKNTISCLFQQIREDPCLFFIF